MLTSCPSLWTSLDFSNARRGIRSSTLIAYTGFARGKVHTAHLHSLGFQGNKLLEKFVKGNRSLTDLSLRTGGEISESLVRALRLAPNLTKLQLGLHITVDESAVRQIALSCSNLKSLEIQHLKKRVLGPSDPGPPLQNLENLILHTRTSYLEAVYIVRAKFNLRNDV